MKNMFKVLGLFAIILTMCLTACSQNTTNTPSEEDNSKTSCVGNWKFEMQGDDEDELWVIELKLNEDETCSIAFFGIFDGEIDNGYNVEKNYYIVENVSELTEDLIERLAYDDVKCTFVYNSETDKLATTFDVGDYISFVREDSQESVEMFENAEELEQYLNEK